MAVKNRFQRKHTKTLAKRKKKARASHQKDSFAFLEHHPSVQKKTSAVETRKAVDMAPETVNPHGIVFKPLGGKTIAQQDFIIPSTFPKKHPDVMAFLDRIEKKIMGGDEYSWDDKELTDNESEQIAQMVQSKWSVSNEDLAILKKPKADRMPELLDFEMLISLLVKDLSEPDQLTFEWEETSVFGFTNSTRLFERFAKEDWACKIMEYALVEKMMTYDVYADKFRPAVEIEVKWIVYP